MRHLLQVKSKTWIREFGIFAFFLALTAIMTWPWVINLRNAVSDAGDPYMIAWTLWWDFHQTFHDPLRLFHANVFFPYQYTLAFSEHDYGIALLFFPLFALGLRPLTVHSIATFSGFAFCGYATFRLLRTLTNNIGAALVAGIVFAFIPYRYHLLSHLHYLFAGWIPLLLESLVLFARERSWRRANWLGVAFLMNGLTCITWLLLTIIPLAFSALLLYLREEKKGELWSWSRAVLPLILASFVLIPFLWPYYKVSKLYNFKWPAYEAVRNSAGLAEWLSIEPRVRVLKHLGDTLPGVSNPLFPGVLPLLLLLFALLLPNQETRDRDIASPRTLFKPRKRSVFILDCLSILAAIVGILAFILHDSSFGFFRGSTMDRALFFACVFVIARLAIAYPRFFQRNGQNLLDTLSSARPSDAFLLGVLWTVTGFLSSVGMSFFVNRVLNDLFLPYRSLRIPARGAMLCYLGLAILAGVATIKLAHAFSHLRIKLWIVYGILAVALLFELHASPLAVVLGAVDPDQVTLRLKDTPMRGGIVDLPSVVPAPAYPLHLAMLRAADHQQPLINATSTFVSPPTLKIDQLTTAPEITQELMDLLEQIPASYVVVHRQSIPLNRRYQFSKFISDAIAAGRLRLVGTYDRTNDLYAVTKTEPNAPADILHPAPLHFPEPRLLASGETQRAAALDALTFRAEPFPLTATTSLSTDKRTRVILFAAGIDSRPFATESAEVEAQLSDLKGETYNLKVENVLLLPEPNWLTQIIIRLPDASIRETKDWWVSIKVRGVSSNKLLLRIAVP